MQSIGPNLKNRHLSLSVSLSFIASTEILNNARRLFPGRTQVIQSAAVLEPLDLALVQRMLHLQDLSNRSYKYTIFFSPKYW
jgi:hypothetical protein